MSDDRWIVVPNWKRFQHYGRRDPIWIKNYVSLLANADYLGLTDHQRGVLHGLWLMYASSHCQLRANTRSLSRQLNARVSSRQLKALEHAGFIQLSASRPASRSLEDYKTEVEVEVDPPKKVPTAKPVDNHAALLDAATQIATDWTGTDSLEFDHQLTTLEQELHARLTTLERDDLWDTAFQQANQAQADQPF